MWRLERDVPLPMSYGQRRLWLLDQLERGSSHYNMPAALKLTGKLDVEACKKAFNTILVRHESLRTTFNATGNAEPVQHIRDIRDLNMEVADLSHLDEATQATRVAQKVAEQEAKAFDLSQDLMLRVVLLKLSECAHIMTVTMHHIASDGWSINLLINEFKALYSAFVAGEANPLPDLAIQYADYAHWQRQWLQGQVLEEQVHYWLEQLKDLPVAHSLPLDKPRPVLQTFVGKTLSTKVGEQTFSQLKDYCTQQGATLFMGLHAVFSTLLARYSNETDIVVGSPVANREQAEIADIIGFFVNTLVLRSDLSEQPSFAQLLGQSKKTLVDAYAHQQVPFELLVDRLEPQRSLSHSPLFQVMLVLEHEDVHTINLPELALGAVEQQSTIAKFDLNLLVSQTEDGALSGLGIQYGPV